MTYSNKRHGGTFDLGSMEAALADLEKTDPDESESSEDEDLEEETETDDEEQEVSSDDESSEEQGPGDTKAPPRADHAWLKNNSAYYILTQVVHYARMYNTNYAVVSDHRYTLGLRIKRGPDGTTKIEWCIAEGAKARFLVAFLLYLSGLERGYNT